MNTLIIALMLFFTLTLSVQALAFEENPLEINEVSILEEGLKPRLLK